MRYRCRKNDTGLYLPFLVITLLALLALIGLAIDGGRAFLTQVRLQRAVDAGAIAGMQEMKVRPSTFVRDFAEQVARENVVRAGLAPTRELADITVLVNSASSPQGLPLNHRLEVTGRTTSPTTFLRLLPGIPVDVNLEANAIAGVPPLAVILVLDRSGSMSETVGGVSKLAAMKTAAINFISLLDAGDWFGVVSYSAGMSRAQVTIPFGQYNPTQFNAYSTAINSIFASGGTCITCGMVTARQMFTLPPSGYPAGLRQFMVVMTDGSPQHDPRPSYSGFGVDLYDDRWHATELGQSLELASCGHSNNRRGQTPLGSPAGFWNGVWDGDNRYKGGTGDIFRTVWESDQARRQGITVLSVRLGLDGSSFCRDDDGDGPDVATIRPSGCNNNPNHPSYCPDPVPAPQPPWQPQGCYDGYFDSAEGRDADTLRPYLLRRLANDIALDLPCDLTVPGGCIQPAAPPFNPMPEYQDYNLHPECAPAIGSSYPRGIFLETPNPSELTEVFQRIFLEIKKARLVG